jgi:hypothetical protein
MKYYFKIFSILRNLKKSKLHNKIPKISTNKLILYEYNPHINELSFVIDNSLRSFGVYLKMHFTGS